MPEYDLILRNATIVAESGVLRGDLGILSGVITGLAPSLPGSSAEEVACIGMHILPGVIDAHVHFNEPGRTEWEGLESGSRAVAAGGGVAFFDMPLNSTPPVLDADSFQEKYSLASAKSVTDFAIWGGLTPVNLGSLQELRAAGVIGLKAFMSGSGIADFPRADVDTLRAGMRIAAGLDLLVAVHAEDESLTTRLASIARGQGCTGVRDYLQSRPISAELDAITSAIEISAETGCALHIVHVSSAEGVALVTAAKSRGVNVTCETCPHYLLLNEDDVESIGAPAKCAPPLRSEEDRQALCKAVQSGAVDTIGSDHSPAPPSMKTSADFFAVWGGISGAQHLLQTTLTACPPKDDAAWLRLARQLSTNVARRFRLPPTQGQIVTGAEANLTILDATTSERVDAATLHYRHKVTPYDGRLLHGRVVRTLLRGQTVGADASPRGRLIVPFHV